MRLIWNILISGLVMILFVMFFILSDSIEINSERIEKLEQCLPKNNVDTVYIINYVKKK